MPTDSSTTTHTQVLIVGAGPIGLELAVELQRAGIEFEILDAGPIGQTMSWWAPQTRWFSSNERIAIAGVPLETPDQSKATREQYLTYLRAVTKQFQLRVRCYEKATDLTRTEDGFRVTTNVNGQQRLIQCRRVVLAVGGTDHPRKLGIEGEDLPHVDGYLREPHRYFGRRVLVIGGRNSAVEAALRLHHAGARVALSYRRSSLPSESIKYWLRPEIEGLIKSGRIQAYFETSPIRISPTSVLLGAVGPSEANSGEPVISVADQQDPVEVPADDVLCLIGYLQDKTLLRRAGVELLCPNEHPQFEEKTMETNVSGLYVAGTAVAGTQSSRYKLFLENCHVHVERIVSHLREAILADEPRGPRAKSLQRGTAAQDANELLAQEIESMPES